jgi:uncharacterized protein (TIGR02145 family)
VSWIYKSGFYLIVIGSLILACCEEKKPEYEMLVIDYTVSDVSVYGLGDGAIDVSVSGGVSPYQFIWSNGSVEEDIDSLAAGTYSVTVTDAADSTVTESMIVDQPDPVNTVVDIEGNIYPVVKIGTQTWMAKNIRVTKAPDGSDITSYCYNDNSGYQDTYGRLYTWDAAMNGSLVEMSRGICPDGWHIPSDGEWKTLEMYLGMTQKEADMVNIWRGEGVGTALKKGGNSGYEALLSGKRSTSGTYSLLGAYEYVWTSTEAEDTIYAWRRCLSKPDTRVGRWNTFPKDYAFSVRCLKDKK